MLADELTLPVKNAIEAVRVVRDFAARITAQRQQLSFWRLLGELDPATWLSRANTER